MVDEPATAKRTWPQRVFWGFILISSLCVSGFGSGAWLSSRFWVDRSEGLAGAAEVFMYGLLSALLHFFVGLALALKLKRGALIMVTVVVLCCALVVLALLYGSVNAG